MTKRILKRISDPKQVVRMLDFLIKKTKDRKLTWQECDFVDEKGDTLNDVYVTTYNNHIVGVLDRNSDFGYICKIWLSTTTNSHTEKNQVTIVYDCTEYEKLVWKDYKSPNTSFINYATDRVTHTSPSKLQRITNLIYDILKNEEENTIKSIIEGFFKDADD